MTSLRILHSPVRYADPEESKEIRRVDNDPEEPPEREDPAVPNSARVPPSREQHRGATGDSLGVGRSSMGIESYGTSTSFQYH